MFPKKIGNASHIRVVAPSRTFKIISEETRAIANRRFAEMGIRISYAKNSEKMNEFLSSDIKSRIEDLHEAFADKSVDAVFTAIGGFNVNEILPHLDYELIKNNPKILCGFSDITALTNAIYAKTGLVTYSGPHFSSFGMEKGFEYTLEYFKKCLMQDTPFEIKASEEWSDDAWFINQNERNFIKNDGHWVISAGNDSRVEGTIIGGNLCTFNLLQGTEYMPSVKNAVLFIEDNAMSSMDDMEFYRNLTSLLQQKDAETIKAVVVGRFQKASNISRERISSILMSKEKLRNLPIIANVDFGHATPIITFPIGGMVVIENGKIEIINH